MSAIHFILSSGAFRLNRTGEESEREAELTNTGRIVFVLYTHDARLLREKRRWARQPTHTFVSDIFSLRIAREYLFAGQKTDTVSRDMREDEQVARTASCGSKCP